MNRRTFLKLSAVTATALAYSPSLHASDNEYKALVCVFLFGGMDNYDTIIPYDESEYNKYSSIRSKLLAQYNGARARTNLLELKASNLSNFNNRQFAMPSEFQNVSKLFNEGKVALIGNVGPLIQPLNKTSYDNESTTLPKQLFSHNDQQATWMSNTPEGSQYGWGGTFCDAVSSLNLKHDFAAITTNGSQLFLSGQKTSPFQISPNGAMKHQLLDNLEESVFTEKFKAFLKIENFSGSHLLESDMANAHKNSYQLNTEYNKAISTTSETATLFPETRLGKQLKAIANTIKTQNQLSVSRQVFIVSQGGYDTHDTQALDLPKLQKELDDAIGAFYQELESSALENKVTLFSASEFGRTLSVNGDGTDHGWGGHQFVLGGQVNGGQIYGDIPAIALGHEYDAGEGRLIPFVSIEQFASPLGKWFGLDDAQLDTVFPNRASFNSSLNFMKS